MKILYTRSDVHTFNPKFRHLFLAGPSPRSPLVKYWRPEAIQILKELKFDGVVIVPEYSNAASLETTLSEEDYKKQVDWEHEAIGQSHIVFWVPRSMDLPGFTTNVEFGWLVSNHHYRVLYGRPKTAHNVNYLDHFYSKWRKDQPIYTDLRELLVGAIT